MAALAAPVALSADAASQFAELVVQVRKTRVAAVSRDAAGAAVLSPTAVADGGACGRGACGRFADYLSFTTPDGESRRARSSHRAP
ncbi:hypothetical protein ACGFNX_41205 [Streptomyces sp. NPDC048723]|uniref:hypothetical protein n=1 Tax=Streptomyces sp. NPDC048723 TaxID=3365589 RepID=UPI003713E80D